MGVAGLWLFSDSSLEHKADHTSRRPNVRVVVKLLS